MDLPAIALGRNGEPIATKVPDPTPPERISGVVHTERLVITLHTFGDESEATELGGPTGNIGLMLKMLELARLAVHRQAYQVMGVMK